MNTYSAGQLMDVLRTTLKKRFNGLAAVLTFDEWKQQRDAEPALSKPEMFKAIDTARLLLAELYVHMDLKSSRRAVNPVRQLDLFRERVQSRPDMPPHEFHATMLEIFKSLGDVHTAYRLPLPHMRAVAFLPFLLRSFRDGDSSRYVVSHSLFDSDPGLPFRRGVEVVSWNGVPIDEAVKRSAEFEEGSNTPHDLALGLQFMTVRWLAASFGPESPWVVVGYKPDDASEEPTEFEFFWHILHFAGDDPALIVASQAADALFKDDGAVQERARSLHVGSDVVHAGRMALFVHERADACKQTKQRMRELDVKLRRLFLSHVNRETLQQFTRQTHELRPIEDQGEERFPSLLPTFLEARRYPAALLIEKGPRGAATSDHQNLEGKRFGYIAIRAFPLAEPEAGLFNYELCRLLAEMPSHGLIVDVRDNPGGSTITAEAALQLLTAKDITPLPFRFLASSLTKKIANDADAGYGEYETSIDAALQTGSRFSAGVPITSVEEANDWGQYYFGPVLLITSATTYSAADIFAAGFLDNDVGDILGVDETTGAGGANCWFYEPHILDAFIGDARAFAPLPRGMNMQISARQCLRVGPKYAGIPIEEIGVRSKMRHDLTRNDTIGDRPWGLLVRAATHLAKQANYDLETSILKGGGDRRLTVVTRNIDRLDFYIDRRPTTSVNVQTRVINGERIGSTQSPPFLLGQSVELEIQGFALPTGEGEPVRVARWLQVLL